MKLDITDIKTKEVLSWEGIHLLHFKGSACSQKLRIFLNIKNIDNLEKDFFHTNERS